MAAERVMMSCRPSPSLPVLCSSSLYWLCMLFISMCAPLAGSLSFNLNFSEPQNRDLNRALINVSGDAYLSPNTLELTRNMRNQNSTYSTGRATYMPAVPLWDAVTGEMAGFTTTFSFRITVDPSATPGDGIAFFLGHVRSSIPQNSWGAAWASSGRTPNGTGDNTMVAIEFDTFQNLGPYYNDISSNHVGIDVNSLVSTASTDSTSPTNNLTSGYKMTATVTYHNVTTFLAVVLNINGTFYYVNTTVDLRSYLPEHVAVGFSAATGAAGELHQLLC